MYQVFYRVHKRSPPSDQHLPDASSVMPGTPWLSKRASWIPGQSFTFLNETREYKGSPDWADPAAEKLWLYNLHYFDFLLADTSKAYLQQCDDVIKHWIRSNREFSKDAWESYPSSLRIVNWIKFHTQHHRLDADALESLAIQVRWLSSGLEYHILANHLLANTKALVFAGLFFQGKEAEQWLRKGLSLLGTELDEQILTDGSHYERTPMYHCIMLEDVLDIINLASAAHQRVAASQLESLHSCATRMLAWHLDMLHPDGRIAFFNDAAFGIAPETTQLVNYAERLQDSEIVAHQPPYAVAGARTSQLLLPSGYACLHRGPFFVLASLAPIAPDYQPGHAHADTLSCEVSIGKHRLFVNSGTSTYKKGVLRNWQRSTAAHNTVEIAGVSSSDVWGGFRVARRARVSNVSMDDLPDYVELRANHDGYRHLQGAPVHQRHWHLSTLALIITDRVSATSAISKQLSGRWLLHPSIQVLDNDRLQMPDGSVVKWTVEGAHAMLEDAYWYPEFGVQQSTKRLRLEPLPMQHPQREVTVTTTLELEQPSSLASTSRR